jgi:hypothetical protein
VAGADDFLGVGDGRVARPAHQVHARWRSLPAGRVEQPALPGTQPDETAVASSTSRFVEVTTSGPGAEIHRRDHHPRRLPRPAAGPAHTPWSHPEPTPKPVPHPLGRVNQPKNAPPLASRRAASNGLGLDTITNGVSVRYHPARRSSSARRALDLRVTALQNRRGEGSAPRSATSARQGRRTPGRRTGLSPQVTVSTASLDGTTTPGSTPAPHQRTSTPGGAPARARRSTPDGPGPPRSSADGAAHPATHPTCRPSWHPPAGTHQFAFGCHQSSQPPAHLTFS